MVRLIGYFFGIGTVLAMIVAGGVAIYIGSLTKDLPDYEVLAKYEPPVMTRVHASDGSLMAEYARERRMYLPIQAIPNRVKAALFLPKTRLSTSITVLILVVSPARL